MKLKQLPAAAALLSLLTIALVLVSSDGARASSFNPTWEVTVADNMPGLAQNADFHFVLPAGDVQLDEGSVFFVPHNWGSRRARSFRSARSTVV